MDVEHGSSEAGRQRADLLGLDEVSASAVMAISKHASMAEPGLTATLAAIVRKYRVVSLVGLDERLKSVESMSRKVAGAISGLGVEPVSLVEALGSLNDAVRYTAVIPDALFEKAANSIMADKYRLNLVHVRTKNTFGRNGYQGCNTTWRGPGGLLFEVQFHSPQSWAATRSTHELYERKRVEVDAKKRRQYAARIARVYATVQKPPGAERVDGVVCSDIRVGRPGAVSRGRTQLAVGSTMIPRRRQGRTPGIERS